MKMTLLDMVIDIMSDMDSDLVSTIGDSEESQQVARIIKSVYFEMISRKDWPHLRKTILLENSTVLAEPNKLKIPEAISKLTFFSYSTNLLATDDQNFRELDYSYPDEFILRTNGRVPNTTTTEEIVIDNVTLFILNDTAPTYYTSFDNEFLVTDSYVKSLSDTLLGSQAQCIVYSTPTWTPEDTFIPDFPVEVFPTFLAEAKSACFLRLKETQDAKSEQQAVRGNIAMAQRSWVVKGGVRYPNYGRQPRKFSTGRHFNPNQFTGGTP